MVAALSPLKSILTNFDAATPLFSIHTKSLDLIPRRINTYEKRQGVPPTCSLAAFTRGDE